MLFPFQLEDLSFYAMLIFAFTFSISLHEWAHAYAAYSFGDATAKEQGRMTLNPLAHIDPLGFLLLMLVRVGYAKGVPVDASRFRANVHKKTALFWISFAGPLSNFLLAFFSKFFILLLVAIFSNKSLNDYFSMVLQNVLSFFGTMYVLNLSLAAFNLIPLPPLDGFHIAAYFLPASWIRPIHLRMREVSIAIFLLLVLLPRSVFSKIISVIEFPMAWLIDGVIGFLSHLFFMF